LIQADQNHEGDRQGREEHENLGEGLVLCG
jgi:hypothetical protein